VREAQQALAGAPEADRQGMINSMVERLAARLQQQPDDVEGWARLGRSYMVLHLPDKARDAYARAVKLRPTDTALKIDYVDAIVEASAAEGPLPQEVASIMREVLQAEPQNAEALWYVGLAEADAGHAQAALDLWNKLLAQLPANAPERSAVEQRIAGLKGAGGK
jgi:cytochrome c-type biogenesis protein CcmH